VDQKLNPKRKTYDSPEKSCIQIKCRNEHICILSPLRAVIFGPVLIVRTDAVDSLVVTVIQSYAETFKATL